jgi:dTDP-4-amino-4,6-dideoxygalactose transaminase
MTGEARFEGSFTQQEPIPEEAIEAAVRVMRSGRLHRYNVAPGEESETAALEREYAAYQGARYCLAVTSGGYALQTALRAWGLRAGEPVLTNAFTLAPVPGAIAGAGGRPVFVETTEDLVIDLDDLAARADATGARLLMLSHMRGHLCDMDSLMEVLRPRGIALIEDCAHTMGATWRGEKSGNFGVAACFSAQTYKHINAGEGGFLTSDDAGLIARATMMSGSYMLYGLHGAGPDEAAYCDARLDTPNMSGRLDNLRAAILRPQLRDLERNIQRWNERYRAVEDALRGYEGLRTPRRRAGERFVGSSIQFLAGYLDEGAARDFVARCARRGVQLKWFGSPDPVAYTSRHDSWRYAGRQALPRTDRVLAGLFDMRLPLTFTVEDCRLIGRIIRECLDQTRSGARLNDTAIAVAQ